MSWLKPKRRDWDLLHTQGHVQFCAYSFFKNGEIGCDAHGVLDL